MSFFKNLFGGKKADTGPSTSETIQKLRDTENMLLKKQEFLEQKVEAEMKLAKENATSNKRGKKSRNLDKLWNFFITPKMTFVILYKLCIA